MNIKQSLRDKAKTMTSTQLPIMENREKGESEDLIGVILTLDNFDFLAGDKGEYVVFTVKEDADKFYFGGKVLTDSCRKLGDEGYLEEVNTEGLPMVLTTKKNKKTGLDARKYTAVQFYPEGWDKE